MGDAGSCLKKGKTAQKGSLKSVMTTGPSVEGRRPISGLAISDLGMGLKEPSFRIFLYRFTSKGLIPKGDKYI